MRLLVYLVMLPIVVWCKRRRFVHELRRLETDCHMKQCPGLFDDELNCIYGCVSPDCYEQVYAADPLEPGEEDVRRGREFVDCVIAQHRSNVQLKSQY